MFWDIFANFSMKDHLEPNTSGSPVLIVSEIFTMVVSDNKVKS